ncbi:hypothetical protein [Methylobacterium indicum]|nr:hypothetical protein [Methylobacterium indicum]
MVDFSETATETSSEEIRAHVRAQLAKLLSVVTGAKDRGNAA